MPNEKLVKVYYCPCGKSIGKASVLDYAETDRATRKEFKQAKEWGRKVEVIPLEQYRKMPFMCWGVKDCIKNT